MPAVIIAERVRVFVHLPFVLNRRFPVSSPPCGSPSNLNTTLICHIVEFISRVAPIPTPLPTSNPPAIPPPPAPPPPSRNTRCIFNPALDLDPSLGPALPPHKGTKHIDLSRGAQLVTAEHLLHLLHGEREPIVVAHNRFEVSVYEVLRLRR